MTVRFTLAPYALTIHDLRPKSSERLDYAFERANQLGGQIHLALQSRRGARFTAEKVASLVRRAESVGGVVHYRGHLEFVSEDPNFLCRCKTVAEAVDGVYSAELI